MIRVPVPLGDRSYEVTVGAGAAVELPALVPEGCKRAAVVTEAGIPFSEGLETGVPAETFVIAGGESAKSLRTVEQLCRSFVDFGLTRSDVVVCVGGGVVTDLGGFAAACYHRGVAVINVPTTLLGQIDAAIGGKTGVNLPEGKNLVGAFWQPRAVCCDLDSLATLPAREWRSGRGEMAKYAFLGVDDLDRLPLEAQVARCVECKAAVVSADEREGEGRMVLNYGHTLAHALEAAGLAAEAGGEEPVLRHGEAVAIGLVFAALLAHRLGRIDAARVERHLEVVGAYQLPTALPAGADPDELVTSMGRDKKATDGLTFVLDGPVGVEPVRRVPAGEVRAALEEMAGMAGATRPARTMGSR
jgi:5-deoxy-5-amino-3-dehydroquinate synthase